MRYYATILFIDSIGQRLNVNVNFPPPHQMSDYDDEYLECLAVFYGYELLHKKNLPTDVTDLNGYSAERVLKLSKEPITEQ